MLIKTDKNYFNEYVLQRIENNKNFVCCCVGSTGSGKTYAQLSNAEALNPKKKPEGIIKNVCFTNLEIMERVNSGELKKGDVLIWEEVGVTQSSREWQSVGNKLVNYLLQTCRNLNLVMYFNTPSFSFLDAGSRKLIHGLWETMSIDYKTNTTEIKPLLIQVNNRTGQLYFKYLRVHDKKHGIMPVKRLYIPLPSKKLIDLYEQKKRRFTVKLNQDIYEELQALEQKKGVKKELTDKQYRIVDLIEEGNTIKEVAKLTGVTRAAIQHQVGLIRKKGVKVEVNPLKKLKNLSKQIKNP